jgi:hypothetical protein
MSFFKSIGKALGKASHAVTHTAVGGVGLVTKAASHIPVVGKPFHHVVDFTVMGPLVTADKIASGARLDRAVMAGIKTKLSGAKGIAPYAKVVFAQVPVLGKGVNAGIGAGLALAEGKRIDKALIDGVKSQLPPEMQKIYDDGVKLAALATSDNRSKIQSALDKLPTDAAKKAFQVGTALGHGQRLQSAMLKGSASPAAAQAMKTAGASKIKKDPVLSIGSLVIKDPDVKHGYEVAVGTFDHVTPPAALAGIQKALNAKAKQGFDLGVATHVGMAEKKAPSKLSPREQFGYYAIHGMKNATADQRDKALDNLAHDNSIRVGAQAAIKEIKGGFFHQILTTLHLAKAA